MSVGWMHLRKWFKGNDTTTLMHFLEYRVAVALTEMSGDSKIYFRTILTAIKAGNRFMKCLYHTGLWLTSAEQLVLIESGRESIYAFQKLARKAFQLGLTRWKFQPKIHMLAEVLFRIDSERRGNIPSLSPLVWCTQQDEDFVGRVSSMSRFVSVRTVHSRTLGRYKIALAAHW